MTTRMASTTRRKGVQGSIQWDVLWVALLLGAGTALAEGAAAPEPGSGHERRMQGAALIGAGFLHEHMQAMIQQMSGMVSLMGKMAAGGTMEPRTMQRMGEAMVEIAEMLREMPALDEQAQRAPDVAMRDMEPMMARLDDLNRRMQELMPAGTR